MSDSRINKARGLMSAGKYDEARKVLKEFTYNWEAKDLLEKIDEAERNSRRRNPRPRPQPQRPDIGRAETIYIEREIPGETYYIPRYGNGCLSFDVMGNTIPTIPFVIVALAIAFWNFIIFTAITGIFGGIALGIFFTAFALFWLVLTWRFFWWMMAFNVMVSFVCLCSMVMVAINPRTTRYMDTTSRAVDSQFRLLDEMIEWTDIMLDISDEAQRGLYASPYGN